MAVYREPAEMSGATLELERLKLEMKAKAQEKWREEFWTFLRYDGTMTTIALLGLILMGIMTLWFYLHHIWP